MAVYQLNYDPIRPNPTLKSLKKNEQRRNGQKKIRRVHAGYLIDEV